MSSRTSRTIAVFEDECHRRFLYRYLIKCGKNPREMRFLQSPSGRGSAEAWVRKQFVRETKVYRRRNAQTDLILIVDADTDSVRDRLRQLDDALREDCQELIAENERVARLVPKRNIETWILCLNQEIVDEDTDYKRQNRPWNELISLASENLYRYTQPTFEIPRNCIESLRSGITELKRLRL